MVLFHGRVAKRTSSRLRRTNDRSVLGVHEDHEVDENAEIGVSLHALHNSDALKCGMIELLIQ
jgi:hypothetical protein